MVVLDAQVHSWCSDRPSRPWVPGYREAHRDKQSYLQHAGQTNSPDMVKAEMAEAGVDGALLTPVGVYGKNIDFELEAAEQDPDRFQVIGLVDHLADDVAGHLAAAQTRGLRGVRMIEMREPERVARGEFDAVLRACGELGLVVMLSLSHPLDPQLPRLFRAHPRVFFYIDHLGTGFAPPILGFRPAEPFRHLAAVLALAELPNVGIKLTGAPSLSAERYPFRDVWPAAVALVTTFGPDRVSWGSDYTRTAGLCSYRESTDYLAEIPDFGDEERALLYGETLLHWTGWKRAG
jgi:predicted TIM-barrel fold metal-dependent hydrolase